MKLAHALLFLSAAILQAQSLDPKTLTLFKQPADVWPTYNGDYSGRRFSEPTLIALAYAFEQAVPPRMVPAHRPAGGLADQR